MARNVVEFAVYVQCASCLRSQYDSGTGPVRLAMLNDSSCSVLALPSDGGKLPVQALPSQSARGEQGGEGDRRQARAGELA